LIQLLDALRKSTGVMVTVEARFIDLQDNFLESIGVDYGNPFNSNLPNPISDTDGAGAQIASGFEIVDAQGEIDVRAAAYNAFSLPLGSSVSPFEISNRGGFALQYNVLDSYALEAILEANQKSQQFRRLNAPRVTAFNTQISHSLVVDQSAYIEDAEVNQTGVVPVINPVIGILNAGSILQVRPTVSHDRKYVILEIEPTLAVQLPSRFKVLTLGLTNLRVEFPVLSVTNIKTTVTIPDGGTVLVGGLKRTVTQDAQVGIPSISRLPFLDFLLGRKGQARMQSNLFVLISSKITVIRDEESKRFN
jgi:general secretion pathway protein D